MFQSEIEQRITEKINKIKKKPVRKAIKHVKRKSKVETAAQKKTNQILKILDNKSLKAGERLEKVMTVLKKHHLLRVMLLTINQFISAELIGTNIVLVAEIKC